MIDEALIRLAGAAIQGSVYFCLVAAICFAFRRLSATWKCWLWRSVSVKFLIGLGIAISIPVQMHRFEEDRPSSLSTPLSLFQPRSSHFPRSAAQTAPTLVKPAAAPPPSSLQPQQLLAAIWLAGFLFVCGRGLLAWVRIETLLEGTSDADTQEAHQLFGISGHLSGLRLRTLDDLDAPALIGIFRPTVLLPHDYRDSSEAALSSAIAHELAHLKRKDLTWILLAEAVKAIFWFDPLTWIACREQLTESEIAADQLARTWTQTSPKNYADHLLEWVDPTRTRPAPVHAVPGLLLSTHVLTRRMKAMSFNRYPRHSTLALGALLVLPLALGFVPFRLVGVLGGGSAASAWPKFHGDMENTGRGGGSGATGVKKWSFKTAKSIESSASIGPDGTIYVGSYDGRLYAIDGITGNKKWSFKIGDPFKSGPNVTASPTVGSDGTVYEGGQDGLMYALDGKTGQPKWTFKTHGYVYPGAALSSDGVLYIGSSDGTVYALNAVGGFEEWTFHTGGIITAEPAIGPDGTVYVGSHDSRLYALDGVTGAKKWAFKTGDVVQSPSVGQDGTVYTGSWDHNVYAIDAATGKQKWVFKTGDYVDSCPAIAADGTIYVGSQDDNVYALDGATGAKKWAFKTGGPVFSSAAIGSDGTVYIGSFDHQLYALDGATGDRKWAYKTGNIVIASPAVGADGTVYFGSWDDSIYAVR